MIDFDALRIPRTSRAAAEQVVAVTDDVCLAHLDEEYADLSRRLVGKLARKRPSPLARGGLHLRAAGVVYALAQVNFLFDRSQSPHLSADRLSELLGVKKTTMSNKGKLVRDTVGMSPIDPEFLRRDLVDGSPLTWLVEPTTG